MRTSLTIMKISILTMIVILACSTLPAIDDDTFKEFLNTTVYRLEDGNPAIEDILFQDSYGYVWMSVYRNNFIEFNVYDGTSIYPIVRYLPDNVYPRALMVNSAEDRVCISTIRYTDGVYRGECLFSWNGVNFILCNDDRSNVDDKWVNFVPREHSYYSVYPLVESSIECRKYLSVHGSALVRNTNNIFLSETKISNISGYNKILCPEKTILVSSTCHCLMSFDFVSGEIATYPPYQYAFTDYLSRIWLIRDGEYFIYNDGAIVSACSILYGFPVDGKIEVLTGYNQWISTFYEHNNRYIAVDGVVYEILEDKVMVYIDDLPKGSTIETVAFHPNGFTGLIYRSNVSCSDTVYVRTYVNNCFSEVPLDKIKLGITDEYFYSGARLEAINLFDPESIVYSLTYDSPNTCNRYRSKSVRVYDPRKLPSADTFIALDGNIVYNEAAEFRRGEDSSNWNLFSLHKYLGRYWDFRFHRVRSIDEDGNETYYDTDSGLSLGEIRSGCKSPDGFWVRSFEGIAHYSKEADRFISYDFTTELDEEMIFDIAVTDSGDVCVLTSDKVYRLNLPDYTPSFHYCNLSCQDSLYSSSDTIVLPYEQSIDVAMRAVQIEYGDRILYNWRLVGQSEDWNGWSKERDVRLERLPRGEYTFEWKMLLPDGGVIRGEGVPFTILPPWWLSTWAIVLWVVSGLMVLAISFYLGWLINRRREKQLERVIEKRTRQLREERDRLQNSIEYASLIQQSILPRPEQLLDYVSDASSLWLPRDIVGGDIWWLHKSGKTFYLAMIDCTGHGVPGAFLTIAAHTYLDSIVEQENSPAAILDSLHHAISQLMNQEVWENRQDGMDIALCRINTESKELIFSGAKLDLYIVRKGELLRYEGERQSIGGLHREKERHFTDRQLRYESGDRFFLLTDGFKDSAVMMDGKRTRLQRKRVEEWMIVWSGFPCADQIDRMHDELTKIKADRDQRDDITILVVDV